MLTSNLFTGAKRFAPEFLLGLQIALLGNSAYSQTVTASVTAQASQFATPVTASFSGNLANFVPLSVASSPAIDPARYAVAKSSFDGGAYAYSYAHGSNIAYPSSAANFNGYRITFSNTPSLQSAIAANSGQPLQFYILFDYEFTFKNDVIPSPGTGNQTTTGAGVSISTSGLTNTTISGNLKSQNGPYDNYYLTMGGFLTADKLNAGIFSVKVPFSISLSTLASSFSVAANSNSLSLSYESFSSARAFLPPTIDVYFSNGTTAASAGLTYHITQVPEPSTLTMCLTGAACLLWSVRRGNKSGEHQAGAA